MAVVSQQKQYITARAGKARGKACFAGILYLLGTIGIAVVAFLGVLVPAEGAEAVAFTLTNFFQPYVTVVTEIMADPAQFATVLLNNAVSLFLAVIYTVMLLTCVINVLRSFAKLDNLFMKGNRKIGYNQSAVAMDKMAKIFSATYASLAVITWVLRLFTMETWSLVFLIASGAFLVIHFIGGLVGGTVSRFASGDGFEEMPRKRGSFSPFLRNLFQLCAVGGLVYFIDKAHAYGQLFIWVIELLDFAMVSEIIALGWTGISVNIVIPALALLIVIFTVVMIRHAVNPSEYDVNGTKGKATVRVASIFILLASLGINVIYYLSLESVDFMEFIMSELVFELLMISAIALGIFIIECIMGKFPLLKKKYREATPAPVAEDEDEEEVAEEEPTATAPVTFNAPVLDFITAPGVYMQPNGTPVMVMPMVEQAPAKATPAPAPAPAAPVATFAATPVQAVAPVAPVVETKPAPVAKPAPKTLTEREKYAREVKAKWIARAYESAPAVVASAPVTAEIYSKVNDETAE